MNYNNKIYIILLNVLIAFFSLSSSEHPYNMQEEDLYKTQFFDFPSTTESSSTTNWMPQPITNANLDDSNDCIQLKNLLSNIDNINNQTQFITLIKELSNKSNSFKTEQISNLLNTQDVFDKNKRDLLANKLNAICQTPEESFLDIAKTSLPQDLEALAVALNPSIKRSLIHAISQNLALMINYIAMKFPSVGTKRINTLETINAAITNSQYNFNNLNTFIKQIADIADISLAGSLESSGLQLAQKEKERARDTRIQTKKRMEELEANYLAQKKLLDTKKKTKESISIKDLRNYKKALEEYYATIPTDSKQKMIIADKIKSIDQTIKKSKERKLDSIKAKLKDIKKRKNNLTLEDLREYEKLLKSYISYLPASKTEDFKKIAALISQHIKRLETIDKELSSEDINLSTGQLLDRIEYLLTLQQEIPNPLIKQHEQLSQKVSALQNNLPSKKQTELNALPQQEKEITVNPTITTLTTQEQQALENESNTFKYLLMSGGIPREEIIRQLHDNDRITEQDKKEIIDYLKTEFNESINIETPIITNEYPEKEIIISEKPATSINPAISTALELIKEQRNAVSLSILERNYYADKIIFLANNINKYPNFHIKLLYAVQGSSLFKTNPDFIAQAIKANPDLTSQEDIIEKQKAFLKAWNAIKNFKVTQQELSTQTIATESSTQSSSTQQPIMQSPESTEQQQVQQQGYIQPYMPSVNQPNNVTIPINSNSNPQAEPEPQPSLLAQIITSISNTFYSIYSWFASWFS